MHVNTAPALSSTSSTASEHRRRLNVVVVDEELPFPLTSGKRIRTYNLIRPLAERHNVTYVCYRNIDAEEQQAALERFAQLGIQTEIVDRVVPRKSGPAFYFRLAANLLSSLPYSVATHVSSALTNKLRSISALGAVDLWQCEWTPYAESMRGIGNAPRLIMAQNVESMIWKRYWLTAGNPAKRWYVKHQWKKFERFEAAVAKEAECVIAVSRPDAAIFERDLKARHVEVVDNGVDTSYFQCAGESRNPRELLFLGGLDWRPNLDGVVQFLERCYPSLRSAEPDVRLTIVGRNPPDWLRRRIGNLSGVELCANVPDVRPYLNRCGMLVVPLRIGGGSRLKILEALSTGTPVVTTHVGGEGLRLRDGEHLTSVENVEDLTPAITRLMRDNSTAMRQAEAGRQKVLREYDWSVLSERLESIWQSRARTPSATT